MSMDKMGNILKAKKDELLPKLQAILKEKERDLICELKKHLNPSFNFASPGISNFSLFSNAYGFRMSVK
jgi:hypothetical protein